MSVAGRASGSEQRVLDAASLDRAVRRVAAEDQDLARLFDRNGVPPLWQRPEGFATLVLLILEQQVSLASARSAYSRLEEAIPVVTPEAFLALDDATLRTVGFSRQKSSYCRGLAEAIREGTFRPEDLNDLSDAAAAAILVGLRGIGPWTAACYLLGALSRVDAWPTGDRALQMSMGAVLGMDRVPTTEEADSIAERWRPWRSVAARLLWHDYLGGSPAGLVEVGRGSAEGRVGSRS